MKRVLLLTTVFWLAACTKQAAKTTPPPADESTPAGGQQEREPPAPPKPAEKTTLSLQRGPSGSDEGLLDLKDIGDISRGLSRAQLMKVINTARAGLVRCADAHAERHGYRLKVTVAPSGRVFAVGIDPGAGTPLEKCVRAVWHRIVFPVFTGSAVTFRYPFTLPRAPASRARMRNSRRMDTKRKGGRRGGSDSIESPVNPDQPNKVNTGHKHDGQGTEDL